MNEIDLTNGGPAFPQHGGNEYKGMSLRHYTATKALPVALELLKIAIQSGARVDLSPIIIAKNAILIADALINEGRLINVPKAN